MKMFYRKITNKMFTTYMRALALLWILTFRVIQAQLFSMDQSKILRIYGDILPKAPSISFDNGTVVPTTEKLHVKHFSNSKINSYLNNIHKNEWFEKNRVPESEVTPKTISEVNNLFNQNQNGDWGPTESSFQPSWDSRRNPDYQSVAVQGEESDFSVTPESAIVSIKQNRNKKRQDSNFYKKDTDYSASNQEITDWSTQTNNFVTAPKETKQQYSTIYKQHKIKSSDANGVRNVYDDWSTPRSMSSYSEWLTTPQPSFTTAAKPSWASESTNSWSPSNFDSKRVVSKTTKKPFAEPLSTSGPDLDEFIARQVNRYKKYNSLYSGVNSYGDSSQDIFNKPRDYRQTPNSISNYNPSVLKDQFDIPPGTQFFDPYSEYQDFSSSTSFYPHSTNDDFVSSTTYNPLPDNNYQSNNFRPNYQNNNYDSHYNNRFNNFNQGNRQSFGEPETIIENKFQTTLKKHFDNTINLYESQSKRNKFKPQQGGKYNFDIPYSNIKFEVTTTQTPPKIVIQNYHITTDHPQNGFSEVYNQDASPRPSQGGKKPQFSQDDIQLPVNYDYTPQKGPDVTFTTESPKHNFPVVEIGGYSKGPPSSYEENYTLSPPPVLYEIPHLQKTEKKKPFINWCRLKSKRYITDKRCVSLEPVVESVCSDKCVMPPKGRTGYPPPPSKKRKPSPDSWTCVESHIQWKKIKLRCQDSSIRWYNLKVVNGCDCRKVPIKITKRITIRS